MNTTEPQGLNITETGPTTDAAQPTETETVPGQPDVVQIVPPSQEYLALKVEHDKLVASVEEFKAHVAELEGDLNIERDRLADAKHQIDALNAAPPRAEWTYAPFDACHNSSPDMKDCLVIVEHASGKFQADRITAVTPNELVLNQRPIPWADIKAFTVISAP
jgi:hypothetical protein